MKMLIYFDPLLFRLLWMESGKYVQKLEVQFSSLVSMVIAISLPLYDQKNTFFFMIITVPSSF